MNNYEYAPTPLEALERITHTDLQTFGGDANRFVEWLHAFCRDTIERTNSAAAQGGSR
jgi:hypothetical protein